MNRRLSSAQPANQVLVVFGSVNILATDTNRTETQFNAIFYTDVTFYKYYSLQAIYVTVYECYSKEMLQTRNVRL